MSFPFTVDGKLTIRVTLNTKFVLSHFRYTCNWLYVQYREREREKEYFLGATTQLSLGAKMVPYGLRVAPGFRYSEKHSTRKDVCSL